MTTYRRAFFDLQLRFADGVAALAGLPRERALLEYTNFYVRFGLGRAFDPAHPGWREYVAGLRDQADAADWTYRFYTARGPDLGPPGIVATAGCFAYARRGEDGIRLHFRNAETDGRAPLAREARERRRAELAALFAEVARDPAHPRRVIGASWLYNLDAYRALFPPAYVRTARPLPGRFQHMPLWGQFIDRAGALRSAPVAQLLDRLGRQASLAGLDACFPLPALGVEAPVAAFREFYGV